MTQRKIRGKESKTREQARNSERRAYKQKDQVDAPRQHPLLGNISIPASFIFMPVRPVGQYVSKTHKLKPAMSKSSNLKQKCHENVLV